MEKTYGEQIKEYRMAKGLNIGQMALKAGVAETTIYMWELGKVQPKKSSLVKIGERLGIEFDLDSYESKRLYLAVTPDKYSLPLAVADTAEELAEMCGVEKMTVFSGISRGKNERYPRYIMVEMDDKEE